MSTLHTKFNTVTILRSGAKFIALVQRWRSVYVTKGRFVKGVAVAAQTYTLRLNAKCVARKRLAAKVDWFVARGYRLA